MGSFVCRNDILIPVAIEIGHHHGFRAIATVEVKQRLIEVTSAVIQQHADLIRVSICDNDIRIAVIVQIGTGYGLWRHAFKRNNPGIAGIPISITAIVVIVAGSREQNQIQDAKPVECCAHRISPIR